MEIKLFYELRVPISKEYPCGSKQVREVYEVEDVEDNAYWLTNGWVVMYDGYKHNAWCVVEDNVCQGLLKPLRRVFAFGFAFFGHCTLSCGQ